MAELIRSGRLVPGAAFWPKPAGCLVRDHIAAVLRRKGYTVASVNADGPRGATAYLGSLPDYAVEYDLRRAFDGAGYVLHVEINRERTATLTVRLPLKAEPPEPPPLAPVKRPENVALVTEAVRQRINGTGKIVHAPNGRFTVGKVGDEWNSYGVRAHGQGSDYTAERDCDGNEPAAAYFVALIGAKAAREACYSFDRRHGCEPADWHA